MSKLVCHKKGETTHSTKPVVPCGKTMVSSAMLPWSCLSAWTGERFADQLTTRVKARFSSAEGVLKCYGVSTVHPKIVASRTSVRVVSVVPSRYCAGSESTVCVYSNITYLPNRKDTSSLGRSAHCPPSEVHSG